MALQLTPYNYRDYPTKPRTQLVYGQPDAPGPIASEPLPYDALIPLPIAPSQESYGRIDGHHAVNPSNHAALFPPEQRTVRWARVQEEDRDLHEAWHEHWDGVPMPENEHQNFATTLFLAANLLPTEVIDVSGPRPRRMPLTDDIRERLQTPGVLHQQRGREWAIGLSFARHAIAHGFEEVIDSPAADEFSGLSQLPVHDRQQARRYNQLGYGMLHAATREVAGPLEHTYQVARDESRIAPTQPATAAGFMMRYFDNRQPNYFDEMGGLIHGQMSA